MKTSKLKITWKKAAAVLLVAAILAFTGCYYIPGSSGDSVRTELVVSKAVAANISSIALVVEGPGMNTISASFTNVGSGVKIDVPPGHSRKFTLLMNTPSATLQGTAIVDLNPGEDREITLEPKIAATEIVVPDYQNGRVVQVSDVDWSGWTARTAADFGGVGAFSPYDVDFDNQGRIYIANYTMSTPGPIGALVRINDINHPGPPGSAPGVVNLDTSSSYVNSVAVDRINGYVYYTNQKTLLRRNVEGYATSLVTFNLNDDVLPALAPPTGIAVDEQGMLYIAFPSGATSGALVKYDPKRTAGSKVIADAGTVYTFSGSNSPRDVMVKGEYVYAIDKGNDRIVRFNKDLQSPVSFPGPTGDPFLDPTAFVATLNRKITVIDDFLANRLASFNDFTGAGWESFGTFGGGSGEFDFYSGC